MRTALLLVLLLAPCHAAAQTSQDNMLIAQTRLTSIGFPCPPTAPQGATQCFREVWASEVRHVDEPSSPGHIGLWLSTTDTYLDLLTLERFVIADTLEVDGWALLELDVMRFMSRAPAACRADLVTAVPGVADGVLGNDFGAFIQRAYGQTCTLQQAPQ